MAGSPGWGRQNSIGTSPKFDDNPPSKSKVASVHSSSRAGNPSAVDDRECRYGGWFAHGRRRLISPVSWAWAAFCHCRLVVDGHARVWALPGGPSPRGGCVFSVFHSCTHDGTAGAYVKLSWPIEDRRALIRIFTAGPIAGFLVSAVFLMAGTALSQITPKVPEGSFILGDSLLILAFQKVFFGHETR